jgi:hypothetical protein
MLAIILCVLACGASYWAGRRSLGWGLIALLAVGYFYGILRANLLTTFSHFIFDAALIGLYLSQSWSSKDIQESRRLGIIRLWTAILLIWPILLVLMPFQPLLVSLVGLRGSVLFIPIVLLGSRLSHKTVSQIAGGLAVLNLIALAFAAAEYFTSVPRFFPPSPVTRIIYSSGDVAGGFFRIPAIFTSAHAYGGMMVGSLPFLIGGWDRWVTRKGRTLAVVGIAAALLGILMSATRQNFVLGVAMLSAAFLTGRVTVGKRAIFLLVVAVIGLTAISNPRFQRFQSLSDTDAVVERMRGSVNRGFFEILLSYPMGNGLGGGGTSIPYFLEGQVNNPIGMENEYARILSEQGVIGLLLWLGFIGWFVSRARKAFAKGPWANSRRLAWCLAAFTLGTGWIGLGLFTSIPGSVVMLLSIGWTVMPMPLETSEKSQRGGINSAVREGQRLVATG